jgi:hypothetical protein
MFTHLKFLDRKFVLLLILSFWQVTVFAQVDANNVKETVTIASTNELTIGSDGHADGGYRDRCSTFVMSNPRYKGFAIRFLPTYKIS